VKSNGEIGFEYLIESFDAQGNLLSEEIVHNIMPIQGCNHMLAVTAGLAAQAPGWWLGLYSGNYTPIASDTAASFPAAATEFTGYEGSTRKPFVSSQPVSGSMDNGASKAEFIFTEDATVHGGFLVSASGKGATTGLLWSAVKFASTRSPGAGGLLRVTAGIVLVSA